MSLDRRHRKAGVPAVTTIEAEEINRVSPQSTADPFKSIPGVWVESSVGSGGANEFRTGDGAGIVIGGKNDDLLFVTAESGKVTFIGGGNSLGDGVVYKESDIEISTGSGKFATSDGIGPCSTLSFSVRR